MIFDINQFHQHLIEDRSQALSYLMSQARHMPYVFLRELMVQHFPKPKTEAVVQEITQLLEHEQREQAKKLLYVNSARFDISDSAFLLQFIEKCRKKTDLSSTIQTMSDRFHPNHFALLGELANRLAYDRETGTASTIHYVLGELGYRCHYTGIYTKVCTECMWPCSTKCRECLRLLCPGCAHKLLPCLRDKVCFTIGINEKPETTTPFYTEEYYPGAFKHVSLPAWIGSIPLEYPDKLVLISLTSRKIVHEFSVCSGECHLAAMQVAGRDVITISRIKRTTDTKIALTTGKLLKHGPFVLCNLETKLLLPDKVNLSRLTTTIGYDTGVLTINRQTIRVHSQGKLWCISMD